MLDVTLEGVCMVALLRALTVIQSCWVGWPSMRRITTLYSVCNISNDKDDSAGNEDNISVVWGQMAINASRHNNKH